MAEHVLADFLIHGKGAAQIAAARIGHAVHIQRRLQPAVLAVAAVQGQKGDVRRLAKFQHTGADHPLTRTHGTQGDEIRLRFPDGEKAVTVLCGKESVYVLRQPIHTQKRVHQRHTVSAHTQSTCHARTGAGRHITLAGVAPAQNHNLHKTPPGSKN